MSSTQEAISRLSIQSTLTGEAEVTAGLNRISSAQNGVAVSSSSSEKATVSLEKSFANIERRYISGLAAQQQYEKIQRQVNAAVAQNPALQDRANAILAEAAKRHDALSNSQKALGVITSDLNGRIQANAGSFGVLGNAITALGPVGLAAAAVIGVVIGAFYSASSAAHALAEKAKEIREFSEATGLTTTQFQALRSEAGKFGIDSETLSAGLSKFTAGFEALRLGNGQLLTDIRKISPALADQMQTTTDAATAFTLFGKAVQQTDNIFQRNALLKAGLGKGSAIFGGLFDSAPNVAALADAFSAAGKGLDDGLIKRLAKLQIEIEKTTNAAKGTFASIFAESTLREEKEYADGLLTIAVRLKAISNAPAPTWLSNAVKVLQTGSFDPATQAKTSLRQGLSYGAESSSIAQAVSDAVPRTRSYNQIVSDQFTGPAAPGPKTAEALASDLKNLVAILGSAATPAERLKASIAELGIKAKEAGVGADELARGVGGLKLDAAIAQQSAHNAALGAAASVTDVLKEKTLTLAKARQQDSTLTDAQIANAKRVAAEQALGTYQIQTQIDAEKIKQDTLFMGEEASLSYSTAQTIINKAIQDGKPLRDDEIEQIKAKAAALAKVTVETKRTEDATKLLQQVGASFGNDLVSGLLAGKSGMEALTTAANNLGKSLTTAGINNIIKDPTSVVGYIEAGVGIVDQLITGKSAADQKAAEELKQAQAQWAAMAEQVNNFNAAAKGFDLGPLTNQIQQLSSTEATLMEAAGKAHDYGAQAQLAATFNAGVTRIVQNFKDGAVTLSPMATAIKAVNDEYSGLYDTLKSLHLDSLTIGIADAAQAQIRNIIAQFTDQLTSGLAARLNTANGKTYLTDASNLLKQHQTDLAGAAELGNNPAVLSQISAVFAAEAQKIVEDAGLVGDSFNDFVKQFPELSGVVNQSTTALNAANDKFKALTDTINQYLDSLKLGSNSILSPQDQLGAAQDQFNRQLGLASGGDQTALGSITQYASALLDQAKTFYASSAGYTDIYKQVTSELSGLTGGGPATGFSSTPTVSAPMAMSGVGSIVPRISVTSTAGNDNSQLFAQQTNSLVQAIAMAASAENQTIKDEMALLRAQNERLIAAIKEKKPMRPNERTG